MTLECDPWRSTGPNQEEVLNRGLVCHRRSEQTRPPRPKLVQFKSCGAVNGAAVSGRQISAARPWTLQIDAVFEPLMGASVVNASQMMTRAPTTPSHSSSVGATGRMAGLNLFGPLNACASMATSRLDSF